MRWYDYVVFGIAIVSTALLTVTAWWMYAAWRSLSTIFDFLFF